MHQRSERAAALAAMELQTDAERRCRHCQAGGAVCRRKTRGSPRYSRPCGKTFHASSGTALSGLHHKQRWLAWGRPLVMRKSVWQSAQRCGAAVTRALRWRHRCLEQAGPLAGRAGAAAGQLLETASQASLQAVLEPLLASDAVQPSDGGRAYPGCVRRLAVQHEAVNVSASLRVRGSYHIQTVNHRHQQWKAFLQPFRGVATKHLDSYLHWLQQVGLVRGPPS